MATIVTCNPGYLQNFQKLLEIIPPSCRWLKDIHEILLKEHNSVSCKSEF